jgi:thioredoxin 1
MSKTNVTNVFAVIAVIAVVAGAAWFKSQRAPAPEAGAEQTNVPTPVAQTDQRGEVSKEAIAGDESDSLGVPASQPDVVTASGSAPASAPGAGLPRLVDLGADKCKACKALAPILDALREEYKGRLSVEFIDVWKDPSAGEPYNIRLIPTQILYDRSGKEVWRHEGFISKEDLKALFANKVGVK